MGQGWLLVLQRALHMCINQGELDEIQADPWATQTQEAANLATQMAQARGTLQGRCRVLRRLHCCDACSLAGAHWELQWLASRCNLKSEYPVCSRSNTTDMDG